MRVSTTQFSNMMTSVMQRQSGDLARTFNDISSGKRIQQPSDDALATVKVQHLNKEIASLQQYISNVDQLEGVLQQEDTLLTNMVNVVQRARENVLLAGNGALDIQNLSSLADEIDEQINELKSLGNYRLADGQYMFAGSNTLVEPIREVASDRFYFDGDEKQRLVAISTSTKLASNDSGVNMFFKTNIPVAHTSGGTTVDNVALVAGQSIEEYSSIVLAYSAGSWSATATKWDGSTSSPAVTDTGSGELNIGGFVTADVTGTDSFTIKNLDTFTALGSLSTSLRSNSPDLQQDISTTLGVIDKTIGSLGQVQTSVGGRLNTLESTHNSHSDVVLMDQVLRSELEDLDYSEAISRLNLQQTALTASQQAYVKIQGLSLFNFL
ncbi:flagellar hook-associated protein FlgL [Sansalvadorimonas verongulae]|uniref:flagellar hook-associated protein FlgL n=1 Tax=Sansalvadorimonas verongulae TaxID=2172824 RepID=UPI0012BB9000|nr:flagellar hook-associated protein FlgL [Sansalvadorimonas verongulae]MTI12481.1 flagellar hook-associated protein 3 [Sansalvadorimonas verongulae]